MNDEVLSALPTFADVAKAGERLRGTAHRTPVLTSRSADERCGAQLFFKCENMQRAGSFKFRGAYNAVAALPPDARRRGIATFSSGNHAQAVALACRLLDTPATILMPADAPEMKRAATRGYGAEIVVYDRYKEDSEILTRALAEERGLSVIPPYDHRDVIAGQGTAALELFEETGPLDRLLVCLGGGGLLSGCALAAARMSPGCRVTGIEPQAGDDGRRSLEAGHVVRIDVPRSIADGALTTHLGVLTFPIIRDLADGIVTVDDDALVRAMTFFAERMKIIVEPTGCLAAAAAFGKAVPLEGMRVGVILSGGNVDLRAFSRLLTD